jgi:protein-arginine kinase activator protein McsA
MLCEKCKQREATVSYMTPAKSADKPVLEFCESCLNEISPDMLALGQKAETGGNLLMGGLL